MRLFKIYVCIVASNRIIVKPTTYPFFLTDFYQSMCVVYMPSKYLSNFLLADLPNLVVLVDVAEPSASGVQVLGLDAIIQCFGS